MVTVSKIEMLVNLSGFNTYWALTAQSIDFLGLFGKLYICLAVELFRGFWLVKFMEL